jgi:hypothetical protein
MVALLAACASELAGGGGLGGDGGAASIADGGTPPDADSSPPESAVVDSGLACFPCAGHWICGGDVARIDLVPGTDGCQLSGLPDRTLLAVDGTITRDGVVIAKAEGTGARVSVTLLDGSLWLFCAAGDGCDR